MNYKRGYIAIADLINEHKAKAVKLERVYMNADCTWADKLAETEHRGHVETFRDLELICAKDEETCEFVGNLTRGIEG